MRRLPALLVLALVAGATLLAAGMMSHPARMVGPFARVVHGARHRALSALAWSLGTPAGAQEVLEFKPVSPESAARIEAARPRRRGAPSPPPAPSASEAPEAPTAHAPPLDAGSNQITFGKSGNIMRVGADIHIESEQVVVGDVMAVGGDVVVDGHVEGDVVAMGGDVTLNSTARVDGDVVCMGGELHEEEGSSIGGQRVTAIGKGRRHFPRSIAMDQARRGAHIAASMVWLVITLLFAWMLAALAPGRTGAALASLKREPGSAALTGFLAVILAVPSIVALALVAALLCITIIGIPLAVAALLGYFCFLALLWVWGFVVGATALGERVAARQGPGPVSLTRAALYGVLLISGAGLVGTLLHQVGLGAIGTLFRVAAFLTFSVVTLLGSGAWLRVEFESGMLSRLWGRRASRTAAESVIAAPPVAAATAQPPMSPPAPPPVDPPAPPALG
jgi:hypothetical protein